jgi:uncharacterized protein (TIGR03437 family)
VIKLDPAGAKALVSFTGLGGSSIAVDGVGSIYLTGGTLSPPPFTPGAFQTSQPRESCVSTFFFSFPCTYAYVVKVNAGGTKVVYLTGLNGTFGAVPAGIAVDAVGDAIVAGTTNSPDFPVTLDAFESGYAPVYTGGVPPATGFAAKLNGAGSELLWSTFFGGMVTDSVYAMAVDASGGVVLAGQARSSDLPGLGDAPYACRPSAIQEVSFGARLTADGTGASPSQLFYGEGEYTYNGQSSWPVNVASWSAGSLIAVQTDGTMTAADLFASSRLACITDPADNAQLSSVAPGEDISVFGSLLASALMPAPTGVTATLDGAVAKVLYESPQQVNLQAPATIGDKTLVALHITNAKIFVPLDSTLTLGVTPQQPSVFLAYEALIGNAIECSPTWQAFPLALALNADGTVNSATHPATTGSKETIFLNGAPRGAKVTGLVNGNPATFTTSFDNGVLAATFVVPATDFTGLNITELEAGGARAREGLVSVCTTTVPPQ